MGVSNSVKDEAHAAARAGDTERFKSIYLSQETERAKKELIEARTLDGKNPLHLACEHGHTELARFVLENGADPNREEEYMNTPLIIAVALSQGNADLVEALLHHGADANRKSMFGNAPLLLAAEQGHRRIVELLVEKGNALLGMQDNNGNSALHYSVIQRFDAITLYLVQKGADPTLPNKEGTTPLDLAPPAVKDILTGRILLPRRETLSLK
jgi:ankyrin repeat protein